jgi:succinate dehydrogenase / fumarate reductase membrane anchor subunit
MNQYLSGLPAWLVQRLSALYMALFTMLATAWWCLTPPLDYPAWQALFAHPAISTASSLFFLALLLHAWVGIRDVILDYAGRLPWLRLMLLTLLGGWLIVLGFWILRIVITGLTR